MCTVIEINIGAYENVKSHIQDITYTEKVRALVHKRMTYTVSTASLILLKKLSAREGT